jgi:hypothetical protein
VTAVQKALFMQKLKVFANRDLRGFELAGKVSYQDPPIAVHLFDYRASAFLIQHRLRAILLWILGGCDCHFTL